MDQSQPPTNFSLQETPKKSSDTNGSRAASARSSRTGSVHKDPDAQLNSSVNFSSARLRRHSNSSQRSLPLASPRPDVKQTISSSVFNGLSQRDEPNADGFFTDRDQVHSVDVNDDEWNETRQWVDELHRLNSSFTTHDPPGPLEMTKDSLGGTTNLQFQPLKDKNDERILPIPLNLPEEKGQPETLPTNHRRPPTPPPSRLPSSTSRQSPATTPRQSVRGSTTSVASKITYDDVCEALKKLEEVEQFPHQPTLKDDAIYLQVDSFSDTSTLSENSTPRNERQPSRTSTPRSSTRIDKTNVSPRVVGPSSSLTLPNSIKEKDLLNRNVRSTQDLREKLKQYKQYDRQDDFQRQLEAQKVAYQKSIEQHVRFLDEVNEDKKKLTARCQALENRIRSIEQAHRLELQRFKDTQAAAEKSRREKWIDDKSRKFKELTVQNLEPEIQKLIDKYQKEIEDLKEIHRVELNQIDVKASERYIRLTDDLREELEREKQQAVARERELARERYEKAIRDERESFVEQRKKLFGEIDEEKVRQTEIFSKQRAELDKLRRNLEEQKQSLTNEIEERVKFFKEKYETAENLTAQLRNTLIDAEAARDRSEKLLDDKDRQINELKRQIDSFDDERKRIENSVRQEMLERLAKIEEENRNVQIELVEVRARQKVELENKNDEVQQLKAKQDRELATLQEKIQQAVVKKDEQVQELRRQYESVVKRLEQFQSAADARKSLKKT